MSIYRTNDAPIVTGITTLGLSRTYSVHAGAACMLHGYGAIPVSSALWCLPRPPTLTHTHIIIILLANQVVVERVYRRLLVLVGLCMYVCMFVFSPTTPTIRTDFPHNALSPQCIVCTYRCKLLQTKRLKICIVMYNVVE